MTYFCPKCNGSNPVDEASHGFKTKYSAAFKRGPGPNGKPLMIITCNHCGCEFDPARTSEIALDPALKSKAKTRRIAIKMIKVIMYIMVAVLALGSWSAFAENSKGAGFFLLLLMLGALFLARGTKVPPKVV